MPIPSTIDQSQAALLEKINAYLVEFFQSPGLLLSNTQQRSFDAIFSDSKNRQAHREYSIVGAFNKKNWGKLLAEIVKPGRLIFAGPPNHETGISLDKNNVYHYYDSNNEKGEEKTPDVEELAEYLFEAMQKINKSDKDILSIQAYQLREPQSIQATAPSTDSTQDTYPSPKKLLKKYADPCQNSGETAIEAVRVNDVSSLAYLAKKILILLSSTRAYC